jgi:hypothetical protein
MRKLGNAYDYKNTQENKPVVNTSWIHLLQTRIDHL